MALVEESCGKMQVNVAQKDSGNKEQQKAEQGRKEFFGAVKEGIFRSRKGRNFSEEERKLFLV